MDSTHDLDDEFSSSSEGDSEFEALLYSQIHHEFREDETPSCPEAIKKLPEDSTVRDEDTLSHLWKLDFQDTSDQTSRYYSRPRRSNIMCLNCKHRGHLSRDCPDPRKPTVCYNCGITGHKVAQCRFQMCNRCMQPGHSSRDCRVASALKSWFCKRCSINGHTDHLCPGLWRMYHLTTKDDGKIVKHSTPVKVKHCPNCAKRGHFIHECPKQQPTYYIPAPIVVNSYEPKVPNLLLQKLGIKLRHSRKSKSKKSRV